MIFNRSSSGLPLQAALCCAITVLPCAALADDRPDAHAPIGVMADHTHAKGEVMVSYRLMHMAMGGSRDGTRKISPQEIATTQPNRFFGVPGQPPSLRVVPRTMPMDMHMVGVMYAPADWITLMAMGNYVTKKMTHTTFKGGMGSEVLGSFKTSAKGFGDTSVSAIFPLRKSHDFELNARMGLSIPTGSSVKTGTVLTPMNMMPELRLPYAMQLGSGSWDVLPGATIRQTRGAWGWGAQYQGTIRSGKNDHGYKFGDSHMATAWVSRSLAPWISTSLRLSGRTTGKISGIDPAIVAPVQTADPDNYGGNTIDAHIGANLLANKGALQGTRLGVEFGMPLLRDLNGPQLETDWSLTVGLQKTF